MGVPAFIIDGKYTTAESMTGSEPRLFEVLDQLIVKARDERGGKKPAK
jgi:thiol:disulfide interchange protein DsbA